MVSLKEGLSNSSCQLQVPISLLTKEEQVSTFDQIRLKFRVVLDVPSCCLTHHRSVISLQSPMDRHLEQWWTLKHLGPQHVQNCVSWHGTFSSTVIWGSMGSVESYKGATSLGLWPFDWPQNRLFNLHSGERAEAKEHRESLRKLFLSCASLASRLPVVLLNVVAETAQPNEQLLVPHLLSEQLLK